MMNFCYTFGILLSVLLLICFGRVHAQPYTTQGSFTLFGSSNNEKRLAHCLDGSGSGSIYATGATDGAAMGQVGGGNWDWFITKYNRNNGFLTANANNPTIRWLLTASDDVGVACASDVYGAVYVTGYTTGILNQNDTTSASKDVVVAKYDANMNRVWIRQIHSPIGQSYPVDIAIYGTTLYVTGAAQNQLFVFLMDASSGQLIRSTAVPPATGTAYPYRLSVDVEGTAIVVGSIIGSFAGTINSRGETIPATAVASNYNSFMMAFYPDTLDRKYQMVLTSSRNFLLAVTTDVNQSVYVSGTTQSSINNADYQPVSPTTFLPFYSRYSTSGEHVWTRIYPQSDYQAFRQVVVDNIGGIFLLRTRYDCQYPTPYDVNPANIGYGCAGVDTQYINLLKSDINGAVQWDTRVSTGVPLSTTLDNTGLLTIGGSIGNPNLLHGVSPNGYDGFLDQITINYNCSCGNLAQLVQEITELLNLDSE